MGTVAARQPLPGASVDEVQALWLDLARWPAFVDGFGTLARREGDWPQRRRARSCGTRCATAAAASSSR